METHKTHQDGAANAENQEMRARLQNILRNGKLAYLRDGYGIFSYEFRGRIKKLVKYLKPIHIANEPRIRFNGIYDIFIGKYLRISTNIIGEFNKYEFGYVYAAPILFSDDFPNSIASTVRYDDMFLYEDNERVRVILDFDDLKELFVGFLHTKYYLDNFFKVDQKNKIIHYIMPKVISTYKFDQIAEVGMNVIKDAQKSRWLIDENVIGSNFENWMSSYISYSIFRYIQDSYVNPHKTEN